MNAFFILNSGDDSIVKSFGFHRSFFLNLCLLFIFQVKPVCAQPWQQLGPGAGGQERALYLHENIAGNYVLYVGSDVSGVWRSRTINPNQRDDPNQYYYDYISNHRIFRFVNKFYRPSTYDSPYLFALSRSGVDRINLFNESEEMKRVSLNYQGVNFDRSWVSDIYIGQPLSNGEHQVYFTTGNTRVSDDAVKNHKDTLINDLYIGKLNSDQDQIGITNGFNFINTTFRDVFCIYVDEGTALDQPTDDLIFIGSDQGLHVCDYSGLATAVTNPDSSTSAYKVTSILELDSAKLLVTIHGQGVFVYETGATINPWTNLMNSQKVLYNQNPVDVYPIPVGVVNTLSFTKISPVKTSGITTGYLVTNEFPRNTDSLYPNAFIGLFYCSADTTGKPDGNWIALDINSNGSQNEWGWNPTPPCANINGAVLTKENELYIGKQGNIFKAQNPVSANNSYIWKQIYTTGTLGVNPQCTTTGYRNRGYVNAVATSVFPENANKVWETYRDRLIWYDETTSHSFKQVKRSSQGSGCYYVDSLYPICGISSSLSDALFVKEYGGLLYSGISEGFSSNQGNGYLLVNDPATTNPELWTQHHAAVCGDPMNYFNIDSIDYLYVNPAAGNNYEIRYWNSVVSSWDTITNAPWNGFHVRDVEMFHLPNTGANYYVILANAGAGIQKIYIYEGDLSTGGTLLCDYTNNSTDFKFESIEILSFNAGASFKILIGCSPTATMSSANLFYELTQSCTLSPVPSAAPIFDGLPLDLVENTDHGVTAIHVDSVLGKVYAATIGNNQHPGIPVKSKLYRTNYDSVTGIIDDNWNEITTNVPNKAITNLVSKSDTTSCNSHSLYGIVKGLGVWKLDENPLVITTSSDAVCSGTETVTASVNNPFGGNPSYLWSTGATTAQIANLGAGTYTVTVASGQCSATSFVDIMEDPNCCNTFSYYLNDSIFNGGIINVDCNLNQNAICNGIVTINGANVSIKEGITITVPANSTLIIENNSTLFACGNMWAGIVVEDGGILKVSDSEINDAENAIYAKNNSTVFLQNCSFYNNYTGIYIPTASTGLNSINFSMLNCEFATQGSLKSAYPGQLTNPGSKAFAGIQVQDTYLDISSSSASNRFNNLSNGVVASNSTLIANSCDFLNITPDPQYQSITGSMAAHTSYNGSAIYAIGRYGNLLKQRGNGIGINVQPSFENCRYGIFTDRMNVDSRNNNMIGMETGYRTSFGSNLTTDIVGNKIESRSTAIDLRFNDNAAHLWVSDNEIHFGGFFSGTLRGISAIQSFEQNGANYDSRIHNNIIFYNAGANNALNGISLNSTSDYYVTENHLFMDDNMVNINGIIVRGSNNTEISCNLVDGSNNFTAPVYQSAITHVLGRDPVISCNVVDGTMNGIRMMGDAGLNVRIQGNEFNKHNRGLFYNQGITNAQEWKGNLWPDNPTSLTWGAYSDNPQIGGVSPYSFDNTNPPTGKSFEPTSSSNIIGYDPVTWFLYDPDINGLTFACLVGNDYYCDQFPPCPGCPIDIVIHERIAQDSIENTPYTEETRWRLKRELYRELLTDSSLLSITLFNDFYSEMEATVASQLEQLSSEQYAIMQLDQSLINNLNQNRLSLETYIDQLTEQLEFYRQAMEANTDPSAFVLNIQALRQSIQTLINYNQTVFHVADSSLVLTAENIRSVNESIYASEIIEENEQAVNEIYLSILGQNQIQINQSSIDQLEYVASQCPLAGGNAVYRARALLYLIDDNYVFDDLNICLQAGIILRQKSELQPTAHLFPTPANNSVTLTYKLPDGSNAELHVFNSIGSLQLTQQLDTGLTEVSFSIEQLTPGVYQFRIYTSCDFQMSGKLVIIR
ncbi:MAG: Secretion system C-terminal sorting domain [Bacteroidota bacterium]|jgi:hypothetical protein